jgi:hypothetical protein
VARRIEAKGAPYDQIGWHFVSRDVSGFLVCARIDRKDDWMPAEPRQMLREAKRALYSAAATNRRKMKRDE